jgi:cytidylate kinase
LLRTAAVNARVSAVSALPEVRAWVNQRLREAVSVPGVGPVVVLDGRDIGSIVFPDAPLKVFLTASPEARAERRLRQQGAAPTPERIARVAGELAERDRQDRVREVAPLRQAEDAVLLDTTSLGFEEQVRAIVALARSRLSLA